MEHKRIIVPLNTNNTAYIFYKLHRITVSMIIDIVELRKDLAEGIKRICREANCESIGEGMKENMDGESINRAQPVSVTGELSDEERHF